MKQKKGFTLIELLVAVSIIAVLTTIGISVYSSAQKTARDSKRKQDLNAIRIVLETYYQENKTYPDSGGVWVYSNAGSSWIPGLVSTYIARLPVDPINNTNGPWVDSNYTYAYFRSADTVHYDLVGQMENSNDPDRCGVNGWKLVYDGLDKSWCQGDSGQYSTGYSYSNNLYEASTDR